MLKAVPVIALLAFCALAPTLLTAAQAPAPASLEARLQRIEDEKAIERLLLEYDRTLDARDFAAYAALFAADGVWKGAQGAYKGPKEIHTQMEKIFTEEEPVRARATGRQQRWPATSG